MKYIIDETLKFFYRHDLNSFFIQNVCKVLNTIDIENAESWLSFNDFIDIISEIMSKNTPKVEPHKNDKNVPSLASDYDRNVGIRFLKIGFSVQKYNTLIKNQNFAIINPQNKHDKFYFRMNLTFLCKNVKIKNKFCLFYLRVNIFINHPYWNQGGQRIVLGPFFRIPHTNIG
jgi:hypothetical protein